MILTGIDTETTGLKQEDGDQIVEIAIRHYDSDTGLAIAEYEKRIKPTGRPISADAERVHGISMSDLVGCPTWEDVASEIAMQLKSGHVLIAHNMDFDGPFIAGELQRVGMTFDMPVFCTMKNARWATFDGKLPKLGELCFALGVEYDTSKAHAALYDVDVMMRCYFAGLKRGFYPELKL